MEKEYFKDAYHSWIKTNSNTSKCTKCGIVRIIDSKQKYIFYRDNYVVENQGCCWHGNLIKKRE